MAILSLLLLLRGYYVNSVVVGVIVAAIGTSRRRSGRGGGHSCRRCHWLGLRLFFLLIIPIGNGAAGLFDGQGRRANLVVSLPVLMLAELAAVPGHVAAGTGLGAGAAAVPAVGHGGSAQDGGGSDSGRGALKTSHHFYSIKSWCVREVEEVVEAVVVSGNGVSQDWWVSGLGRESKGGDWQKETKMKKIA